SRPVIMAALKRDEVRRLNLEAREPDPAAYLEEGLTVDFKDNSELLTIKMSSTDPAVATAVANAVKQAFLDDVHYARRTQRIKDITELDKAFNEASDALEGKKKTLKEKVREPDVTDPALWAAQRAETLLALRDAKQERLKVGLKLVEARASLDALDLR